MNQRQRKQRLTWWEAVLTAVILIPLAALLIALVLVVLLLQLATSICLHIIIWFWWCLRGKDILFVYSDSTIWHDYIEEHMLPHLQGRAVVLNWSERKRWRVSLSTLAFQRFGGHYEFNPLAIVFRPMRPAKIFRFWKPFQDFKHGNPRSLQEMQRDFLVAIGAQADVQP